MKIEKNAYEFANDFKPKNFKYKFIFHDDEFLNELLSINNDIESFDTINDDELTYHATHDIEFLSYDRETVSKAKQPYILDNGVILSKKLIKKADKKLLSVNVGLFDYNNMNYVSIVFKYEKFDILEIFIIV